MKGIYFYFYCRRSCYLYILQDLCFYCKKEILLLLFLQLCKSPGKSWNFVESPGKVLWWKFDAKSHGKSEKKSWNLNQLLWWEPWLGRKSFYGEMSIRFLYVTIRAYFSHLLCAVFAHNALFVELNALFSAKNSKNTCCLRGVAL